MSDLIFGEAFSLPTILLGFLAAEWARQRYLLPWIPGNPAYRLAGTTALSIFVINIFSAFGASAGVVELQPPAISDHAANILFFAGVGPFWWFFYLMASKSGLRMLPEWPPGTWQRKSSETPPSSPVSG